MYTRQSYHSTGSIPESIRSKQSLHQDGFQNPFYQRRNQQMKESGNFGKKNTDLEEMNDLKQKVYGMLKKYVSLFEEEQNLSEIKRQMHEDSQQVKNMYQNVTYNSNHPEYNKMNQISNLAEDFISNFSVQQTNTSYQSSGLKIKEQVIQSTRRDTGNSADQYRQTNCTSNGDEQRNLEMTVLNQFPHDNSFYDRNINGMYKINQKIMKLKQKLEEVLQQDQMHYSRMILSELINNLKEVMDTKDQQLVKTIMFRIEDGINQIQKTKDSVKLYNYLQKAINYTKKKELFVKRQDNIQQQVRHTAPLPQNRMDSAQSFRKQQYARQSEQIQGEMKGQQQMEVNEKRKFFDLALMKKNVLSEEHPGKNIMISELYAEYLKQKVRPEQMEAFINLILQQQQ